MDDNTWLIELESALLDECNVNDIYSICNGKAIPETLRPDVWQICLDVRYKNDQMALFNEIFDLPFQTELRHDCSVFVDKLGNDEEDKLSVVSDLESILTFYCKNRSLQYESNNGWIELLLPVLSLKLSRSYTYNLFEAIRDTYIPKGCVKNGNVFHLFRLLILYHDPELCSLLDTKKITPDQYSMSWFQSLFAATCTLPVVLNMWDMYFQQTDPFLVFYLALIMLINGREQILTMKEQTAEEIVKFLTFMPCALEAGDVVDFCSLAQYYAMKTPSSFKTGYLKSLFGADTNCPDRSISQALCLPVTVYELIENISTSPTNTDSVRFFLVDCRPADQYNYGHLPTAFHLDSNLMLQEPVAFSTAVYGLLRAQKMAIEANSDAGGEHLCFMGSGRLDEDMKMHMVVASFLQKNTQYVSVLTGGFASIHDYFGQHTHEYLKDHDPMRCLMCIGPSSSKANAIPNSNSTERINHAPSTSSLKSQPSIDLFSKFSSVVKSKSQEVKGKFMDYIANPYTTQSGASPNVPLEKHVNKSEKNGKRYRNVAPVFSIDEDNIDSIVDNDEENANNEENVKETINIQNYTKNSDVITALKCQEVHMNGYMYDSHLILTTTHLIVLRDLDKKGTAEIIVRRPLSNIVKITAKKRHRDLITFKYGIPDGEELLITDMDRFLIPNASEATALVSKQIIKQLENTKNEDSNK
ncbi:TBC1 domain family member 23 isoform X1 [Sitodiplosis mosellana]|uniref:TBC1 domain family member 23 isoform X1 n=1 Tax=Sitodiplosis mosellana TaxID=263140 RepID=UPI0024445793|nr:TBC1 domain family member 23 isoform X1 [Sitodiplosis mosellana]